MALGRRLGIRSPLHDAGGHDHPGAAKVELGLKLGAAQQGGLHEEVVPAGGGGVGGRWGRGAKGEGRGAAALGGLPSHVSRQGSPACGMPQASWPVPATHKWPYNMAGSATAASACQAAGPLVYTHCCPRCAAAPPTWAQ